MSRIANAPISLPSGVEVTLDGQQIKVKGSKGELEWGVHELVSVKQEEAELKVSTNDDSKQATALAGTTRALVNNMVVGVSEGFEKKLELQGVGYRAKAAGKTINLTVGYSHPIDYQLPDGVTADTPSQTEKQMIISKASQKAGTEMPAKQNRLIA